MILLNLVIGAIAGLVVPIFEQRLKDLWERLWQGEQLISDDEFDLAALLVLLMVAAAICAALGVDSSAFLLALGALIGLFGKRAWAAILRGEP